MRLSSPSDCHEFPCQPGLPRSDCHVLSCQFHLASAFHLRSSELDSRLGADCLHGGRASLPEISSLTSESSDVHEAKLTRWKVSAQLTLGARSTEFVPAPLPRAELSAKAACLRSELGRRKRGEVA